MKKYILSILILITLQPLPLFSQTVTEDVMYMKNGTVYRGSIIEQIPSVSYKIEIAGGSVIFVKAEDVAKITKEDKAEEQSHVRYYDAPHRSSKAIYEYKFRPKGYFFQSQLEMQALEFGFRIVNGYKFGRLGYLGLGIGVDGVILDLHGSQDYSGAYFPFYIHYGGDILKKQTTPFYSVEIGYAAHFAPTGLSPQAIFGNGTDVSSARGGVMGGGAFGVRFYSRRRVHFDISAHVDFKQSFATINGYAYDPYGNQIPSYYTEHSILIIPGVRFGIGF